MLGALDPFAGGQQGSVLVAGPGRIPRLPGPAGEFVAGDQGAGVLGALDPFAGGQQDGELVAGTGRIPRLPGPSSDVMEGGQGGGVLRAVGVTVGTRVGDQLGKVPGRWVATAIKEVLRDPPYATAGQVQNSRACGSSTAQTGQAAGSRGSAGTAASTKALAACSHWPAASADSWARVMACTRRCTSTSPSPAGLTGE